jgi:stringent starvation protein B
MSDRGKPLPPKKEVALALLEGTADGGNAASNIAGSSMFVHIDPRCEGVEVPKWFKKQPQLVLQLGFNLAVAIPDLNVGDDGISCTLSFNRSPHWCFMPWSAIYALIGEDGRAMIWPDDVPAELAKQLQKPKLSAVPSQPAPSRPDAAGEANEPARKKTPKPALAAVAAVADEPPAETEPEADDDTAADDIAVDDIAADDEVPNDTVPPPDAAPNDAAETNDGKKKLPSYLRVIK